MSMTDTELAAAVEQGASTAQLAEALGVSPSTVKRRRARIGCAAKPGRPKSLNGSTVRAMRADGMSVREISHTLKAADQTVRDHINGVTG